MAKRAKFPVTFDIEITSEMAPAAPAPQVNEPSEDDLEHDRRLTVAEAELDATNSAAPATEAASPPERIWLDIRPPGLNPYENPVYWHPTKSLNPRYETGEAEYVRADFSASRPAQEQARRVAEKAAEKIAIFLFEDYPDNDMNRRQATEHIAAIILSAEEAAPEEYPVAQLVRDLATMPLDALADENAPMSARMQSFSVLRHMQERAKEIASAGVAALEPLKLTESNGAFIPEVLDQVLVIGPCRKGGHFRFQLNGNTCLMCQAVAVAESDAYKRGYTAGRMREEGGCPMCGSHELENISGNYETGVVAPDGGREVLYEQGYRCSECGAITDDEELNRISNAASPAAAPQGDFRAGVAACVEKVKDAALGYRSPTSGMVGMEVRDALWAVAGKLESLTDSAAKETE